MGLMTKSKDDVLARFLKERIKSGSLNGRARSIAELALNHGPSSLNEEQSRLFDEHVIAHYGDRYCRICGESIPLDEAIMAADYFQGRCSRCSARVSED